MKKNQLISSFLPSILLASLHLGVALPAVHASVDTQAASGSLTPAGSVTIDQLVSKNAAARGGASAWQHLNTLTMSGQMDVGKGMMVPYTLEMKRGRKQRLEIQFAGKTAVQVFDGAHGYKKRPFLGHDDVQPFTAEELEKASLDSDLDGPLMGHLRMGARLDVEGREKVEGKDNYKIKLTLKNGQTRHVWVDAQSFLETKVDGTRRMDGKQKAMETYYRDYRTVNGLLVPFSFETSLEGVKGVQKIQVEKVVVNPSLDDSVFAAIR